MDILLIVVLVVLGGFALHGYLRGLVRMMFSLAAIFLVIGITSWLAPYAADLLREQTPLYNTVQEKCLEAVQMDVVDQAAEQIAEIILQRIAWFLTFITVSILLGVLVHVLDLIAKLPVLDSVNHIGGLSVGLLEGLVIVWILFLIIILIQYC